AFAVALQLVPHGSPHAGKQFIHAEWLGDIVVGAEVEGGDLADLIATTGEDDDRRFLLTVPDPLQQIVAVDIGKPSIENDECWFAVKQLESELAIWRFQHLIALRGKAHTEQLADWWLVVHHQDLCGRSPGHSAAASCSATAGTGKLIVNTAPGPSDRLRATIVPCMASMKPREMAKPRPVPARTWSAFCAR